jgi:hypothetical protein
VKQAVMPETWATPESPTTYGALLTAAREGAALAITRTPRLGDPDLVAVELAGYERFLRVAGIHLALLQDLSGVTITGLEQLRTNLRNAELREVEPSMWLDAAKALGAAHDLVATHAPAAGPRTAEAMDLVVGPASLSGCRDVTLLIEEARLGCQVTINRFRRPRTRIGRSADLSREVARIRKLNSRIEITTKATLWELEERLREHHGPKLDELQIAVAPSTLRQGVSQLECQLSAIRLLRQLTFLHSQGRIAASPASLRDLATLGARMTDPGLPLPEPRTALGRVRLAHARDRMDIAHAAWNAAGRDRTESIRGLSKAPTSFRTTIESVVAEPEPSLSLRVALTAALPHLGRDAVGTVTAMTSTGSLLTRQPVYAQPRKEWRRIQHEEGALVAGRFREAGLASVGVSPALRDLLPRPERNPANSAGSRPGTVRAYELVQGSQQ